MPFVVSGSIHEAESVLEDPFTLESIKFLGADGTKTQNTKIFAVILTLFTYTVYILWSTIIISVVDPGSGRAIGQLPPPPLNKRA